MTRLTPIALALAALVVGCGEDDAAGDSMSSEPTRAAVNDPADKPAVADAEAITARPARKAKKGSIVKVVDSDYGRVVADRAGEALYLFDKEKGKRSECYGECAEAWPPLLAKGKPRAGSGARKGLLGTTRRKGGKRQVTYAGHPLYYYVDDSPGQILCQNVDEFGGLWLVVKPNGAPVR